MRESVIENYLTDRVEAFEGEVRKVKWIGRRGAPDRLVMLQGVVAFVELKAPGKPLKAHQKREHERMRRQGACVLKIDTLEQVDQFIDFCFRTYKKTVPLQVAIAAYEATNQLKG